MNAFALRGVIVPILTPFTGGGEALDEGALRDHAHWLIGKGVHGLMPCGTTGEGPLLGPEERRRVLEVVVEAAASRLPVIAHVGAPSTRETVELARHALACGAAALSVVTPYYYRLSDAALLEHYCRVAAAVPDMPVFLYNIPQNAGNRLAPALAAAIAERCPNVVGIKDSAGDLASLLAFAGLKEGRFQVVCGSDSLVLNALEGGACASVSGNANVCPEVVVGLFEAFWRGNRVQARHWQERLHQVRQLLGGSESFSLMKRGVGLRGLRGGSVRPPLLEASDEAAAELEQRLRALQLL